MPLYKFKETPKGTFSAPVELDVKEAPEGMVKATKADLKSYEDKVLKLSGEKDIEALRATGFPV